jgi:hypothetical protein
MKEEFKPGDRVCIKGQGTDAMLHKHGTVERLTQTMIVTTSGRRFRHDSLYSIPYQPYGGTKISKKCQVK